MATRRVSLLEIDQNLILQLKAIISSPVADFDKLDDDQKKTLFVAALAAGYKTNLELWLRLKEHPEYIGLPPRPPEVVENSTVNAQILATLVADLENKETLDQRIDSTFKSRSEKDRTLIKLMVQMMIRREQARVLAANADPKNSAVLRIINQETDPKRPPLPVIQQAVAAVITASITQTEVVFTKTQTDEAVNTLTVATIAGLVDYSDPVLTSTAIQAALGSNPEYQTDVTAVVHQIEENLTLTPLPNYESSTVTQASPSVALTLNKISLPDSEIKPEMANITLPPPLQDRVEEVQALAERFSTAIATNPKTDPLLANLTGTITPDQEKELVRILIAENLVTRSSPTQAGNAAATVIEKFNPTNPLIDAATIRVVSMGLDIKSVENHLAEKPASKLVNFIHQNPNVLRQLRTGSQHLDGSKLGAEIRPSPLSGLAATYQTLTNRVSGFLGQAGQIFNAVTHPFQFIQGKIGNFIGNRIVGQFKNWLAEKVVSRIANETLKKGAEFILKRGLQEGVKLLAKEGLKRGLQAVAQLANIAPGAGLLLAVAIEAAFYIGGKTIGAALKGINNLFRAFTGEDFDARAALALPLAALAGIGGILGGLGAATSVAAMSAGVALVISAVVGFFLYITVITVAPIITTIAQLDSGLGPQQGPAFGGVYEPYTGPILPGCSQIWPVSPGFVLQGPHGTYSHASVEAVDIYVSIGTPVKSMSSGVVTLTGWGDAYGNWIQVRSTSEDGKSYTVIYAHLSEIGVQVGTPVGVGTLIALSGASSSVPGFANPHLHMEYRGIAYNSCPAGGVQVPDGCVGAVVGKSNACLINGKPIYTK